MVGNNVAAMKFYSTINIAQQDKISCSLSQSGNTYPYKDKIVFNFQPTTLPALLCIHLKKNAVLPPCSN
jgi:hypothetical protein